jgi:hypothetical protein
MAFLAQGGFSNKGAQHADRSLHYPANERDARVEPLQRGQDAAHAAADVGLPDDFAAKL